MGSLGLACALLQPGTPLGDVREPSLFDPTGQAPLVHEFVYQAARQIISHLIILLNAITYYVNQLVWQYISNYKITVNSSTQNLMHTTGLLH